MTDKLRAAAEMVLEELTQIKYGLERNRVWGGMEWSYVPIHPTQYLPLRDKLESQIAALRQALAEPEDLDGQNALDWHHPECEGACLACLIEGVVKTEFGLSGLNYLLKRLDQLPDTTKMIDTGIDRGAWDDVPDATKWVDELRGDDDEWDHPPQRDCDCRHCKEYWSDVYGVEPIGEIVEAHGLIAVSIPEMPPVGTKLYAAPPVTSTEPVAWIGYDKDGRADLIDTKPSNTVIREFNMVPLYTAPPKREWQGLTDDDIHDLFMSNDYVDDSVVFEPIVREIEAKLKEKNHGQ